MSQNNKWKKSDGPCRPVVACGKSLTRQSFRDEADVNKIIAKFAKTGMLDNVRKNNGVYADLSGMGTYHEALNNIHKAQNLFNSLPANVRGKFKNDPGAFVEFMNDPEKIAESVELGLRLPKKVAPKKTPEPKVKEPAKEPAKKPDKKDDK